MDDWTGQLTFEFVKTINLQKIREKRHAGMEERLELGAKWLVINREKKRQEQLNSRARIAARTQRVS